MKTYSIQKGWLALGLSVSLFAGLAIVVMRGYALDLTALTPKPNESVAPLTAEPYKNSIELQGDTTTFHYVGDDGTLDYSWKKPAASSPLFGTITLKATGPGRGISQLQLAAASKAEWITPAEFVDSGWSMGSRGPILTLWYVTENKPVTIELNVQIRGKALWVEMNADRPVVRSIDAGGWPSDPEVRKVPIPYDPFETFYYPQQNLFVSTYFDWTDTQATHQQLRKAVYTTAADGNLNKLHERVFFIASWHLDEVFPNRPKQLVEEAGQQENSKNVCDAIEPQLLVDFDLLKFHSNPVTARMNYGPQFSRMDFADKYQMCALAFGHPVPARNAESSMNLVAWNEEYLAGPVAKRYRSLAVQDIQYFANGNWTDIDAAARAEDWRRVQVKYSDGTVLVANSGSSPITWRDALLPQYGWAAKGPSLWAYTALKDDVIVDYAETSDSVFANARHVNDVATEIAETSAADRLNRFGKRIDFGPVRTDGSVYIERSGDYWVLRPFNPQRMFYIALNLKRFPKPVSVEPVGMAGVSIQPVDEFGFWSIPLNGAREYRWR